MKNTHITYRDSQIPLFDIQTVLTPEEVQGVLTDSLTQPTKFISIKFSNLTVERIVLSEKLRLFTTQDIKYRNL